MQPFFSGRKNIRGDVEKADDNTGGYRRKGNQIGFFQEAVGVFDKPVQAQVKVVVHPSQHRVKLGVQGQPLFQSLGGQIGDQDIAAVPPNFNACSHKQ